MQRDIVLLDALCASLAQLEALADDDDADASKALQAVVDAHPDAVTEAVEHAERREAFEAIDAPDLPWRKWAGAVSILTGCGVVDLAELASGEVVVGITDGRWSVRRGERVHLGPAIR